MSLNYHLNTILKLQSGIDADARYDSQRDKIAKLFLPLCSISFKYLRFMVFTQVLRVPERFKISVAVLNCNQDIQFNIFLRRVRFYFLQFNAKNVIILYKTYESQFNCDDSNHVDKMPFFTTSLILMTNIWALRTVDKSTLRDFIQKTDQLKQLMILLLCCVTLFKYKPEAVLSREKKRNNQSKQNLGK